MRSPVPIAALRAWDSDTTPLPRLYAIDWLRVAAVFVVFLFHAAHIFDLDPEASLKNRETSLALSVYVFFVYQWMMHVIFVLAGASAWFSMRVRGRGRYLRERCHRLLVPFFVGSVTLIPWNGYMSALNHDTFRGSFYAYFPVHFERTWAAITKPALQRSPIVLFETSWHLWFLGHLFVFSWLTASLFLYAEAEERRGALLRHIDWLRKPWGLTALGLPVLLIKLALDAAFPAHTDWSETLVWFTLFCYGWLFIGDPNLLLNVANQAGKWFAVGCACFVIMAVAFSLGYLTVWLNRPAYTWDYSLYQVLASVNTWAWVLAIIGFGLRWLNFNNAGLQYASEATLPFYILHQTVIFTIGFVVVQYRLGVFWKFSIITVGSFVTTLLVYQLLVRRSVTLQILLGMKPRRPQSTSKLQRELG